ncbi:MAG TPA: hypothetical protein VNR65_16765, partial [Geobacterales bacterium]|nr:hypothetical protein [Geobacterales bacterium]
MAKVQRVRRIVRLSLLLAWGMTMAACQLGLASAGYEQTQTQAQAQGASAAAPQSGPGVVIENEPQMPDGYPHRHYELRLHARGGVSVL